MVDAPKENHLPLPTDRYGSSTKPSTQRPRQTNQGKSRLQAKMVQALRALRGLQSKKKHVAKTRREMPCWINKKKEKWIKDCGDRESAVARKPVEDAEPAIK